ncbi:MAG: type II secretion system major pseudopilin GspG [Phycisphaerae bacterium]
MQRRSQRRRSAFTLIELLLVAGILALLAAFAIPRLFETATEAKIDLAKAAIGPNGPIATALETYKYHMGKYPDTDEGLAALLKRKEEVDDERYKGPYLGNDKLLDPFGKPFGYRSPGEIHEEGYDLWSGGPDGEDNSGKEGSDDIKNWIEK